MTKETRDRVVVAMSGGVDSSVAAYLLQAQGYEVIGIGMRLPGSGAGADDSACCGIAGMDDARHVADVIGIPFYVLNYERTFTAAVIDPFCQAYAAGHTPNPCVLCNSHVKFGPLLDTAIALGATYLATGHYARAGLAGTLLKALDPAQDQSYFLWGIPSSRLAHTLFPLGELNKRQVRAIAAHAGLPVSQKPGSQDICFLQGTDYREYLLAHHPEAFRPGPIVNSAGRILGRHAGVAGFTLGQRKGLRVAAGQPLYVQRVDVATATVVVGPRVGRTDTLCIGDVNWLGAPAAEGARVTVRARYRGLEAPATLESVAGGSAGIRFDEPQPPAAPGQSAVLYAGNRVVGGGVILNSESHATGRQAAA